MTRTLGFDDTRSPADILTDVQDDIGDAAIGGIEVFDGVAKAQVTNQGVQACLTLAADPAEPVEGRITDGVCGEGSSDSGGVMTAGTPVAWGDNQFGQTNVPTGLNDVVAIAAGETSTLALRSNGELAVWGSFDSLPASVSSLADVVAIANGGKSFHLALREDGTVINWDGATGTVLNNVSGTLEDIRAIFAANFAFFAVGADGSVVGWKASGEIIPIPEGLGDVSYITAFPSDGIALALRSDGSLFGWHFGDDPNFNEATSLIGDLPVDPVVAIQGRGDDSFSAIELGGQVVEWGAPFNEVPWGINNAVAISSGWLHTLDILSDGTVVSWGSSDFPWLPPGIVYEIPEGLSNVFAISAGAQRSVALTTTP